MKQRKYWFTVLAMGLCIVQGLAVPAAADAVADHAAARAKAKERQRAWFKAQLVDSYEKVGVKHPKWDAAAREFLSKSVENYIEWRPLIDYDLEAIQAGERAIKAGCTDPLVGLLFACDNALLRFLNSAEAVGWDRARGIPDSKYGPYWKALYAKTVLTGEAIVGNEGRASAWTSVVVNSTEAAQDPDAPLDRLMAIIDSARVAMARETKDQKTAWEPFEKQFTNKIPAARLHLARGEFLISWAWEARGSGWAHTVTPEGWQLFHERLREARKQLQAAWDAGERDARVPAGMITVERGDGGDMKKMQEWFDRGFAVDPERVELFDARIEFIKPKWHGSPEEMIKFARQCLKHGAVGSVERFNGVRTYDALGLLLSENPEAQAQFYQNPEVWNAIQSTYEPYLKDHPTSLRRRTQYAQFAYLAGQDAILVAQVTRLNDRLPRSDLNHGIHDDMIRKVRTIRQQNKAAP